MKGNKHDHSLTVNQPTHPKNKTPWLSLHLLQYLLTKDFLLAG
jgi:hypothetical protein